MNAPLSDLERLFEAAAPLAGEQREAYLDEVCPGNPALRSTLQRLLRAHDSSEPLAGPEPEAIRWGLDEPGLASRIGPYGLLERIGEGGCGVVYVAEQIQPVRRRVALKVIKPGMDTKSVVARFEAERQALAMMDHPNIAKVFDAGTTEAGRPFFVMELVRGIRITEHCDERRLSTEERLQLFIKVCQAIQHAHQKGVIHRDIKPSNILVTLHDGVAVPKIIDFGIAKAVEGRLTDATVYTQLHQFIGTPAYMSPEQAEMSGLDTDTRSDIYSLGVLLYELLVGRTPFDAQELIAAGVDAMRRTIREKEPLRPSTRFASLRGDESTATARRRSTDAFKLQRQLKGDLDWIVMKCLEKDRARRYETATGLAVDTQRFLNHEAVSARPPSAAYRFRKTFRRHRLALTAGALVFVALTLGLAGAAWQWRRAEISRRALAHEAYWAEMKLANQAADQGQWKKVADILDRTRPRAGDPDLRGWEWRYLWGVSRGEEKEHFTPSPQKAVSLVLLPDGHTVAVGEEEGGFYLWDLREKRKTYALPGKINQFKDPYSPVGQALATRLASIPGRRQLAYTECTAPTDARVQIWDPAKHATVRSLPLPYEPRHLAVSPDGRRLAVDVMGPIRRGFIFALPSGQLLRDYTNVAWDYSGGDPLQFSPDGKWLTLEDGLNTCAVVDVDTGQPRYRLTVGDDYLLSAAFSPDGRWLATSGGFSKKSVRLWDLKDGSLSAELPAADGSVWALNFDSGSSRLIAGAAIWNIAQRRVERTLSAEGAIASALLLPDDRELLTATGADLSLWDLAQPAPVRKGIVLDAPVRWFDFLPDDEGLLVVATNGDLKIARAPAFTVESWPGETNDCLSVCVPPGRKICVVGHRDGTITVRNLAQHTELRRWRSGTAGILELAPVGKDMVTGFCTDGNLRVWRVDSGEEHWQVHLENPYAGGGYDPLAGVLYDIHGDRGVTCYDLVHRAIFERTLDRDNVNQINFSADGSLAIALSGRGPKQLINGRTLKTIAELDQVDGIGHASVFWPDNSRAAISGENVRIIDPMDRRDLLTLKADFVFGWYAYVSPKGSILAQRANMVPQLCVWRAPSWQEINAAGQRSAAR